MKVQRILLLGFGLVLSVVVALAAVAWRNRTALMQSAQAVSHTREVIAGIQAIRAALLEAEAAARGYVITGDEEYRGLHDRAAATISERLDRVGSLTSDDPGQQGRMAELRRLAGERLEGLRRIVRLRAERGLDAVREWTLAARPLGLMARIQNVVEAMSAEEDRLLTQRIARLSAATHRGYQLLFALAAAAATFLVAAGTITLREMRRRQQAQAEAQQQAATVQLIVDSVGEGIVVSDATGALVSFNPAARRILGKGITKEKPDKWQAHYGVFHPDGTPVEVEEFPLTRALRGEPTDEMEQLIRHADAPAGLTISVAGRPLRGPDGAIRGGVAVFRDITARKRHEAEVAAANRELEAFSYSVAHDLRAPLRAIDGFSQALLEDYADELDAQGRDYLGRVRAAAQRMAQLIDDLLGLARLVRSEMKHDRVNLTRIAQEVAAELARRDPSRAVEFRITDGLVAGGDARLLRVALENLLGNAWKFTGRKPAAHIEFGARNGSFFVRDDGVGFDMTHAQKLFGAFQRLHAEREFQGTGIGLATVQRIVHRHGGRVWAEGTPDQGATFFFTLPHDGDRRRT